MPESADSGRRTSRRAAAEVNTARVARFELRPRPPFRLELTAWTLRRQAHNAVDRWDGDAYRRTLALETGAIEVCVRQRTCGRAPRLAVELHGVDAGDADVQRQARRRLRRLLGLGARLDDFYALAAADPRLSGLAARYAGMRPPRFPSLFEALANAVACQQISLNVGIGILNRLAERFGVAAGGGVAFPRPVDLLGHADPKALRALGFSMAKARTLLQVAEQCETGALGERRLAAMSDRAAVTRLSALWGIGRWTAEYALLRGLGRWHVFPGDDVGARKHLAEWLGMDGPLNYQRVADAVARWHGHAGLVYFHLLLRRLDAAGLLGAPPAAGQTP